MVHFPESPGQRLLDEAVAEFARATQFSVSFGGYEADGITTVTAQQGNLGNELHGLRVASRRGLGGRAKVELRPRFTTDYRASRQISHDYDAEIGSEGIVMLFAVPVLVHGETRAVLYGGSRGASVPDRSFMHAAGDIAASLAREIRAQDLRADAAGGALLEELRSSHAELRRIAAGTTDPHTREQLRVLEQRLLLLGNPTVPSPDVQLTPRETDVLAQAALGGTNAQIGAALGITESTVKGYVKTAMAKLRASTRQAAVIAARGRGLLP